MTFGLALKRPLFDLYEGEGNTGIVSVLPTATPILPFSHQTVLSVKAWPVPTRQEENSTPEGSAVSLNPGSQSDVLVSPASPGEYLR